MVPGTEERQKRRFVRVRKWNANELVSKTYAFETNYLLSSLYFPHVQNAPFVY
jgi:hypothetical protein